MKITWYVWVIIVVLTIVIIRNSGSEINCQEPYTLIEKNCCLDINKNYLCDDKEIVPVSESVEETELRVEKIEAQITKNAPSQTPTAKNPLRVSPPAPLSPQISSETRPSSSDYDCNSNIYNCDDFSTHSEAQKVYESCGGVNNDIHQLDRDKDGSACESL